MDKNITLKSIYEYSNFEKYHDKEFIINIYRAILKREPDSKGLNRYLNLLRDGHKSKMEIITMIRASKEGRFRGVKLLGFYKRLFLTLFYTFPPFSFIAKNSRDLNKLENSLYRYISNLEKDHKEKIENLESQFSNKIKNLESQFSHKIEKLAYRLDDKIDSVEEQLEDKSDIEDIIGLYQKLIAEKEHIALYLNQLDNMNNGVNKRLSKERKQRFNSIYTQFENRFQKKIEDIFLLFLPFLHAIPTETESIEILDISVNRTSWLSLLAERGYNSKGIDSYKNIEIISYLKSLPSQSLSLITGFNTIAQLDSFDEILELLEESHRLLKSNGFIIYEASIRDEYLNNAESMKFFTQKIGFKNVVTLVLEGKKLIDIDDRVDNKKDYFIIGYKL